MRKMKIMIRLLVFSGAFFLLNGFLSPWAQSAEAPESGALYSDVDCPAFSLTGRYKNLFVMAETESTENQGADTLMSDMNRVRLTPEIRFSENFLFHADVDNEIFTGNYLDTPAFEQSWRPWAYNDLVDPYMKGVIGQDWIYQLKLHRCYAKLLTGKWTLTLGRQQVRFGSARIWNPLDILNPISPTFVEGAEDQKGVDALRVEYYPGSATEIAAVYAPRRQNDVLDSSALANENANGIVRFKTAYKDTDLAVLGGVVAQRKLIGLDVAGIFQDGLLRGAALHSTPEDGDAFWLASAGYEYTFANGLYALIEYFYNGNALNDNPKLAEAYFASQNQGMNEERYLLLSNQFLTYNAHYLGMAAGYDVTPLVRAELFVIFDIEGKGAFLSPSATYNMFQNIDVALTLMMGRVWEDSDNASDFQAFEDSPLVSASAIWYF